VLKSVVCQRSADIAEILAPTVSMYSLLDCVFETSGRIENERPNVQKKRLMQCLMNNSQRLTTVAKWQLWQCLKDLSAHHHAADFTL
jgi:hypothetical protein